VVGFGLRTNPTLIFGRALLGLVWREDAVFEEAAPKIDAAKDAKVDKGGAEASPTQD
jgi:hypothetical protein